MHSLRGQFIQESWHLELKDFTSRPVALWSNLAIRLFELEGVAQPYPTRLARRLLEDTKKVDCNNDGGGASMTIIHL